MKKITLANPTGENYARGRNGFFTPAEVVLWSHSGQTTMDVYSARVGRTPPVVLRLNREQARELANAILAEVSDGD